METVRKPTPRAISMPAEFRGTLLKECRKALGAVFGEKTVNLEAIFLLDRLLQSTMGIADHGALHVPVGERRRSGHLFGKFLDLHVKLLVWINRVYHPNPSRLLG